MDLLDCPVRTYDWGSTTAIAALQGRAPSGEPEAELWIGAHPSAPSRLTRGGLTLDLDEVIAADPVAELGPAAVDRFDGRLPFLMKLLAAAKPLSLQAHPSLEQARRGFQTEEAAGLPIDSPHRLFRDANHKPELICAVAPLTVLCGFRDPERTVELLSALDAGPHGRDLVARLAARPDARGLRECMIVTLEAPAEYHQSSLDALRAAAADGVAGYEPECAWLVRLADEHPNDPAVFVAALLELVVLDPGEALFLPAGNLHSYLGGIAVEVMANSDNVIRGGLTSKHVDVNALTEVVSTEPGSPSRQRASGPVTTYRSPVDEFALTRLVVTEDRACDLPQGPAAAVVVAGHVELSELGAAQPLPLDSGHAAWLPASGIGRRASGQGTLFVATIGPGEPG